MTDQEFNLIIDKLKEKAVGNVIENVVETYRQDEKGKQTLENRVVKKIFNEIDTQACIKLIDIELKRREIEKSEYETMSDEELEKRRQELIEELKNEIEKATQ